MLAMAFSGYVVSVENLLPPLRLASNLFPIKHCLIILRRILVKGMQSRHFPSDKGGNR